MGLREKVALIQIVIILLQVIFVTSSHKSKSPKSNYDNRNQKRSPVTATIPLTAKSTYPNNLSLKNKSKLPLDINEDAIRKAFNFPDIEYPWAPLPSQQFFLQDTNILKGNQVQTLTDASPINNINNSNKIKRYKNKKYDLAKLKIKQTEGIPKAYTELSSKSKPICFRDGIFPAVEYPLNIWDTWKPDYWPLTPSLDQEQNDIQSNCYSKVAKKSKSFTIPKSKSLRKSKDNITPVLSVTKESTVSNPKPDESKCNKNIERNDIYSNISNQTPTVSSIPIKTPCDARSNDPSSVSPLKIHNDDKTTVVSSDNKITSISDVLNTVVFESSDNKDSCFEDNVIDSNKSSVIDVDEEFTTDVLPDFDENMWYVSTSTMSPISVVDINEAWANHVIADPFSEAEPDELEAYFILLP